MGLNLDYVSNIIKDDYKNWNKGDTIIIEAQTSTGKNFFVENIFIPWINPEKVLFVSNRTNLKRQVKRRLLEKHGLEIPETLEELDEIKTIENVTVASYHALQYSSLDERYKGKLFDLNRYSAIVLDECHFVFSDSGYNNLCRFTYKKLIATHYSNLIKIFMSATINEVYKPIKYYVDKILGNKFKIHTYKTGKDYSNVKVKYINHYNYKDIITNLILNDKTDEKWLIFISDLKDGYKIMENLGEDKCSIIKSGTKSEELISIINDDIFKKKVLIATKVLDNGINLKDNLLVNMVILAWDEVSLIQMLGRKRISIDNPQKINLYLSTRSKKAFQGLLRKYNRKQEDIDLLLLEDDNKNSFNNKYDNKLSKISDDIIYKDSKTNEFMINPIGEIRLKKDTKFAEYMIEQFENTDKFAYIRKQLEWLEMGYMFDEKHFIEEVMLESEIVKLEDYLESLLDTKVLEEDQIKLKELLTSEAFQIDKSLLQGTKKMHPDTFNSIMEKTLKLPYKVTATKTSKRVDGKIKKYTYWTIVKTLEL